LQKGGGKKREDQHFFRKILYLTNKIVLNFKQGGLEFHHQARKNMTLMLEEGKSLEEFCWYPCGGGKGKKTYFA